jgi:aminoglycoside 6'-N-acetyltransferase
VTDSKALVGDRVELGPIQPTDVSALETIRAEPSVHQWWGSPERSTWTIDNGETHTRAVWRSEQIIGFVQWYDNTDPRYRYAGIDLFLSESTQGHGYGRETVALVLEHLLASGHHRVVIDPAASNERAIACYRACGFETVGVMRRYERDNDGGGWHDGLLMEYVVKN